MLEEKHGLYPHKGKSVRVGVRRPLSRREYPSRQWRLDDRLQELIDTRLQGSQAKRPTKHHQAPVLSLVAIHSKITLQQSPQTPTMPRVWSLSSRI
jgi:hypothetical protein